MKRIYIKTGELVPTIDGIAVCSESPRKGYCCKLCCFRDAPCAAIACDPEERPDGKWVVFTEKKGGKK